jgi:hypothetical protein
MKIVNRSFTPLEFEKYLETEVAKTMSAWRPRGVVLHNTDAPTLANWPGIWPKGSKQAGQPITVSQRLKNIQHGYEVRGWKSGPHLFVDTKQINVFNPINARGTHSPSFNTTHWGIELVGDYAKEIMPPELRHNAVVAIALLYAMLGHIPSATNFYFHKDDPRTSHKGCPGKNAGPKDAWIKEVREAMASINFDEHGA